MGISTTPKLDAQTRKTREQAHACLSLHGRVWDDHSPGSNNGHKSTQEDVQKKRQRRGQVRGDARLLEEAFWQHG